MSFVTKMETNVLFCPEPKDKSDVIWIDENQNEYHLHSWILDMQSNVFKGIYKESSKHSMTFPPNTILVFAKLLYLKHGQSEKVHLKTNNAVAILRMCYQYECKYLEELCIEFISKMLPEPYSNKIPLSEQQHTDAQFVQDVLKFCVETKNESLARITICHIKHRSDIVELLLDYHGFLKTSSKRKIIQVSDHVPENGKHLREVYKIKSKN